MTSTGVFELPPRQLEIVKNLTPFRILECDKMGPGRHFFDVVVVKGTFRLTPDRLVRAEEQPAPTFADEWYDPQNATRSSLSRPGDAVLFKPATDIFVTGTARSARGPRDAWDVAVGLRGAEGTILGHGVRATGPRKWQHRTFRGWVLSDPTPTREVPIRYELSYGGYFFDRRASRDGDPRWRIHRENPSGTGFFDEEVMDTSREYPGPQWHAADQPVRAINTNVPFTGLGPVSRTWQSRTRFAGTYDDAWRSKAEADHARGLPIDYPPDFDPRFFQCAHPALIAHHLRGDELLGLAGLVDGYETFGTRLPGVAVRAALYQRGRWRDCPMPLDTVHVDLDARRVSLSWRLLLNKQRGIRAAVLVSEGA